MKTLFFVLFILAAVIPAFTEDFARLDAQDAEITSNLLLLEKGGETTRFQGAVRLLKKLQWLESDEMTRTRLTGVSDAVGNVRGTWFSEKGEKIIATGDKARYTPLTETTELWGGTPLATLTRWESESDSTPVFIQARHFTARQKNNDVLAAGSVIVTQRPRFEGRSDEARYDRTSGTMEMWGASPVRIHINDEKGKSDFESDRAWIQLEPRKSRLTGRVKGRVVPAKSS